MGAQERIVLAHSSSFRLGAAEVRPATREIVGPSDREVVEPRVMQVLVALADAGGEPVTRDDLIERCWEGRIVGEDSINRVISKIRRLGETVAAGSFGIETITKVGYRLIASDGMPVATAAARPQASLRLERRTLLGGAALLALGGGAVTWFALGEDEPDMPPAAAKLYAQADEALRFGLVENNAQAVAFLRQAVAIAPDSAEAWGKLAIAYQVSRNSLPPPEAEGARLQSRSAARRALALDPRNPAAYAALALDLPMLNNWAAVEAACRRALALDPRQFEALSLLAFLLWSVGRIDDAIGTIERIGQEVAMLPLQQYRLAMLLWSAGRLEECDRVIDRAMSLWPRNFVVWFARFWFYARTGRGGQALALSANRAMRPTGIPEWNFEINELGARALATRSQADIDAALAANLRVAPQGAGFAENAMQLASSLGRLDEAFALADAYYFHRGFSIGPTRFTVQQGGYSARSRRLTHFLFAPSTEAMRKDQRFLGLIAAIGLTDYWRKSGTRPDVRWA